MISLAITDRQAKRLIEIALTILLLLLLFSVGGVPMIFYRLPLYPRIVEKLNGKRLSNTA